MIQNPIPNVSMMRVQGDPNQNCSFLKAITLKLSTEKKPNASQTHFGFSNIGSEMHCFRVKALRKEQFWFGSPCSAY